MANIEGNGKRGDLDGRGTKRDVVGNTIILREERPRMIRDYEQKGKAITTIFKQRTARRNHLFGPARQNEQTDSSTAGHKGSQVKAYCLAKRAPRVFVVDNILAIAPVVNRRAVGY
jgi:hypothetical protein